MIPNVSITHHEFVLGPVDSEFFETDGQVVYTDPSVPVHIQDLKEHFQPMLLPHTEQLCAVLSGSSDTSQGLAAECIAVAAGLRLEPPPTKPAPPPPGSEP